jgi:hypothetical protein
MSESTLKKLVGALAVVALLWVVATLLTRGGGSLDVPTDLAATFEGVTDSTTDEVRFIGPDDTIELTSEGDAWRVNGFQADSGSVARFFSSVAEAKVGDLVATNPANHERMGVAGDSVRTLEIDAGGETRRLLVGGEGPRLSTAYVRLPDQDEVYLLGGGIRAHVTRRLDDWRNRKMIAIDTSQVVRLDVSRAGDSFTLVRGDSAWTFQDGSPTVARQVTNVLEQMAGSLVASGFVPDGDSIATLPQDGSAVAYSDAGNVLARLTFGSGTGDRWAMAVGDSVRYRIASFRANLIAPTRELLTPQ